jgi:hypothetical protein
MHALRPRCRDLLEVCQAVKFRVAHLLVAANSRLGNQQPPPPGVLRQFLVDEDLPDGNSSETSAMLADEPHKDLVHGLSFRQVVLKINPVTIGNKGLFPSLISNSDEFLKVQKIGWVVDGNAPTTHSPRAAFSAQ